MSINKKSIDNEARLVMIKTINDTFGSRENRFDVELIVVKTIIVINLLASLLSY